MARPTRDARRRSINVGNLNAGDWVILAACFLLFVALIGGWWTNPGGVNSVRFSQLYFVAMLVLILATIVLIIYPLLQAEAGLRPLPLATPPILIVIGFLILLGTVYELGRYRGIAQTTVSPGFGIYFALICSVIYLIGALAKWGSRERRIRGET